jgi:hypothetical protein
MDHVGSGLVNLQKYGSQYNKTWKGKTVIDVKHKERYTTDEGKQK